MRELTPAEHHVAESLALSLADMLCEHIPALFAEPPEVVVGVTLPVACELVRLEAKASRNRRHARAYRKARREAGSVLRAALDAPVAPYTVAFDPRSWHTALVPGARQAAPAQRDERSPA